MFVKLYLHYDGPPQYSKVFKLDASTPVRPADLLQSFVNNFNQRFSECKPIVASNFYLKYVSGKRIDLDANISPTQGTESDLNVFQKTSELK